MKNLNLFALAGGAALLVACGSPDPSISSITVSPATLAPGAELTVNVNVADFELVNPDDHTAHALRAAEEAGHEHGDADADYPSEGHFHVYMDSIDENPLMLNCPEHCKHPGFASSVRAMIPDTTAAGSHKIIVLLNNNGHMTLTPHIRGEADFTVQ